jgi:hypothetical protein
MDYSHQKIEPDLLSHSGRALKDISKSDPFLEKVQN